MQGVNPYVAHHVKPYVDLLWIFFAFLLWPEIYPLSARYELLFKHIIADSDGADGSDGCGIWWPRGGSAAGTVAAVGGACFAAGLVVAAGSAVAAYGRLVLTDA